MAARIRHIAIVIVLGLAALTARAAPVLDTRDKAGQCEAVYAWVALTREFAGEKAMTGNMTLHAVRTGVAPAFADDLFPDYFGKRYFDLSQGDKKKIMKAFQRCSENNTRFWYGNVGVSEAFQTRRDRYHIDEWEAEIRKHTTASALLAGQRIENEVQAARQQQAEIIRSTRKIPQPNKAGDLLLDTRLFAVHGFRLSNHDFRKPCDVSSAGVQFSVVVKDHKQRLDEAFIRSSMRDTIVPLASRLCPGMASRVWANYYFKDVHLDSHGVRFTPGGSSEQFGFYEMPFVRATHDAASSNGRDGLQISLFSNHTPTPQSRPYYETLAGLEHIVHQEFLSDAEWEAVQAERAAHAAAREQSKIDAVTLAGFRLEGAGGIGLITGFEPQEHFNRNRRDLAEAVMGYAVAISATCPSRSVPGGTTPVVYTTQETTTDTRTGHVSYGPETRRSFLWPGDFMDIARTAVDTSDAFSSWLDQAEKTAYYRDVQRMAETRGCGSEGLRNYHANLKAVAEAYRGDWNDFTSLFELLGTIFGTPY